MAAWDCLGIQSIWCTKLKMAWPDLRQTRGYKAVLSPTVVMSPAKAALLPKVAVEPR